MHMITNKNVDAILCVRGGYGSIRISSFNEFTFESLTRVLIKPQKHYKYPYEREPDFENKIVYLEDVGEQTYRMGKMIFHLL